MPYDPWTLIGWLLVAILVIAIASVPAAVVFMIRIRRRSIRQVRPMRPEVRDTFRARANRFPG